ncbi:MULTISPECIES: cbb3-type cytochrome oxidase subunit 3 [unclassified Hahella]|uniref:cbb3-type cytochrome oxidase subunit 3 n=1 Tax=unclassified Hahella TaxID=2624107 RepID=UPI001C1EE6B0|nr:MULTISPECIES: cbb3-type cytochrome c oxidase subunit 3 [unclassified Hahella]MBU6954416.1 cbb3-type cytochrome c oxidase subunit 3 [Hahella sp. HN01]MDG9667419.1 cbb3-type cytochrome c oxidase subunit 3 [Hahella sp. CR1]
MDINTVRGLATLFIMAAFIALVVWAFSSKQKKTFDEAANLPFEDDEADAKSVREAETKKHD